MSMLLAQGLHSVVQATPSPRGPSRLGATTHSPILVPALAASTSHRDHNTFGPRATLYLNRAEGAPNRPGHTLVSSRERCVNWSFRAGHNGRAGKPSYPIR
jgi:hypothetical protein